MLDIGYMNGDEWWLIGWHPWKISIDIENIVDTNLSTPIWQGLCKTYWMVDLANITQPYSSKREANVSH